MDPVKSNKVEPMKDPDDVEYGGYQYQYRSPPQPYQLTPPTYPDQQFLAAQQAPPNVFVVHTQSKPVIVQQVVEPTQSFCCPIVLSCIAFWFCGVVFGLIGFILAVVGKKEAENGNTSRGRSCSTASFVFSIIGIITGIIIIITLSIVLANYYCHHPIYCNYGSHYVASGSGCKQCCPYYSCSYGSYYDNTGCRVCCQYSSACGNGIWASYQGSYNTSYGASICCYNW